MPRCPLCASAQITRPAGAPARARSAARSLVDAQIACHSYARPSRCVTSRAATLSAVGGEGSSVIGRGSLHRGTR